MLFSVTILLPKKEQPSTDRERRVPSCVRWPCRSVYGIPVTFIHPLHPSFLFDRDRFYGQEDDFER